MKYFVGIDQGGSKCDILVGDEYGNLIDRYINVGYSTFINIVKTNEEFYNKCVEQQIYYMSILLNKHQIESTDIYALAASSALINNDDIRLNYEKALFRNTKAENVTVYNDMISAWRAGTNTYPSGVIGIGTGTGIVLFAENHKSINLAEKIEKQANRELGFRAFFHACYSALQMLEPTILTEYICKFAETNSIKEALEKTNRGQDINALHYQHFVPFVYEAVLKKDRVAEDFINEVALNYTECIRTGIYEMQLEKTPFTLVLNGGAFKGNGYIMENLLRKHLSDLVNISIIQSEYEPVYGALMLAYEKYNNFSPNIKKEDISKYNLKRDLVLHV